MNNVCISHLLLFVYIMPFYAFYHIMSLCFRCWCTLSEMARIKMINQPLMLSIANKVTYFLICAVWWLQDMWSLYSQLNLKEITRIWGWKFKPNSMEIVTIFNRRVAYTFHNNFTKFDLKFELLFDRICWHYTDAIMGKIASQITSLMIDYSTVYSDADQRKYQAPRHWPLCGEFTGDRWIPRKMASNAENVSIWWRHHDMESYKPVMTYIVLLQGCQFSKLVLSKEFAIKPALINFRWAMFGIKQICELVCQKQGSRAGTRNYIPQILWVSSAGTRN